MGIVSDSDFEKEISNSHVPETPETPDTKTRASVEEIKKGRGDKPNTPEDIRKLAAISAINSEGTASEIAKAYGISEASVSAYKVGATSTATYDNPNQALAETINTHKAAVTRKARNRLMSALNHITPQKLEGVKARDLAAIAKDMSAVIKDFEPQVNHTNNVNNVQFVFMAPRVRDLEDYKIIDVD